MAEPDTSEVRQRLLEAATALFVEQDYERISTRQIAQAADCNIGMIRYYFNNKLGLFEAVIRNYAEHMVKYTKELSLDMSQASLGDVLAHYYQLMQPMPDFPKLILRVMSMPNQSEQQKVLHTAFAVMPSPIDQLINGLKQRGELRAELDNELVRISLLSLMVFPFLVPESMLKLQGITADAAFFDRLATHSKELLRHGLAANS